MGLKKKIERLLYAEADALDRADLDAWIELYTDDGSYWMPTIPDQPDPLNHISLFYDDRVLMEVRRRNFRHPRAASKEYDVRCSHLIGNIQVVEKDKEAGTCRVTSNFHCLMYYAGEQTAFAGRYTHDLTKTGEGWKIRHKRVDIINADAEHGSLVIYL